MKKVKIVIGANFGDEGKGLLTDYFCSTFPAREKVLNVRFNGGAQAGHTVVKSDGRRHVFSHFGSGSFNENNLTYLSPYFILNPMLFVKEYKVLESKGVVPKVYIHKDCLVTFPCDVMINQMVEAHRDKNRHGSCGVGIYETIKRTSNHQKTTIGYIRENFDQLATMIAGIIEGYVPQRLDELNTELTDSEWELIRNENITENYSADLLFMLQHTEIVEDNIINEYNNIVFEGAQGLLLDADNMEYYPHLTPSNTGIKNALEILSGVDACDLSVCYVTRSYFTRHGAGLFKTECDSTDLKPEGLRDKTNQTNSYQGNFRYGYFDVATFKHSVERDLAFLNRAAMVELAVTHLDETGGHLILGKSEKLEVADLLKIVNLHDGYISNGETIGLLARVSKNM
ncbi:MAG TPA: adenylosuccinate synthase [Desulfosporosinus sp.]|nr:adenylosuccinate synthase [Desulfosporosinus sp.]